MNYPYYGGKGIECNLTGLEIRKIWFRDKAYKLKHPSIDRINSGGNYDISNCRFIEMAENASRACKSRRGKFKRYNHRVAIEQYTPFLRHVKQMSAYINLYKFVFMENNCKNTSLTQTE